MNDWYIKTNYWYHKNEFNKEAQKGQVRVVSDTTYAYNQNQDIATAAWSKETWSKQQKWEGTGLINI